MQFWNKELAWIARGFASECVLSNDTLGQNLHILTEYDEDTDLADVVELWRQEGWQYDYESNQCSVTNGCDNYLQVSMLYELFALALALSLSLSLSLSQSIVTHMHTVIFSHSRLCGLILVGLVVTFPSVPV